MTNERKTTANIGLAKVGRSAKFNFWNKKWVRNYLSFCAWFSLPSPSQKTLGATLKKRITNSKKKI